MAELEHTEKTEHSSHDNTAEAWYNERQARIVSERARVEAQEITMRNAYAGIENQWQQLNTAEEEAHDSLDTRELVRIQSERQRLLGEADKLNNGLNANQQERQQIALAEHVSKLDFQSLYDIAPEKSKLFLEVFRSKLDSPAAVKKLLQADSVAGSKYTPCTNDYYAAIEQHMGWGAEERRFTFENERRDEAPRHSRRENADKIKATEAQRIMAKNLPGIDESEYLKACAQPFSNAAQTVSLDSDELNFGQGKPITVSLDESPKQAPAKYRQPNPKTSVNLSPAELSLIENMAVATNRPLAEVRTDFAKQKLALHSGKTSHMLYEDRLKAMGQA